MRALWPAVGIGVAVLGASLATWAIQRPSESTEASPASLSSPTATPGARADLTPRITAVLDAIKAADRGELAVSEEDGRFLRTLIVAAGARKALEIGAASGYSAIWIGLGLRETGGRLVTIEYDPERARQAAENIARAGLDDVVRVIVGDGFAEIPRVAGTFDFVFLDAWKKDYKRFFDLVFPRLDRGGLFVAHNVVNKRDEMRDFLAEIDRPDLLTSIVSPSSEGMSVSVRR